MKHWAKKKIFSFKKHSILPMRHLFFLCCIVLLHSTAHAQIEIFPKKLDFGITSPTTQWVVDVIIKNNSSKKDYLLRSTFTHEYEVLYSSKTLLQDSSVVLRIKFKPRAKGKFNEKIELYFASLEKPMILPVTADVAYLNPEDNLACPDFSRLAADCCVENEVVCEVINAETKQPIADANVAIKENGVQQVNLKTNATGKATRSIPIGYYELLASHKDYLPQSTISYVNNRKSYFLFELQPIKNEIVEEINEIKEWPKTVTDTLTISSNDLPENLYKDNNIVFLLDVSSSMKIGDKMALMKGSLLELTKALRATDKITLISYADETTVLLATTSGSNKGTITTLVYNLVADGNTAGAKGFKKGYEILRQEFLKEGNNQLIVITDGAFQPEDQKQINKLVKKYARKKLKTSIVGINANYYASLNLNAVSEKGNGSFILIKDDADLQLILEEIKKQSAR
jgi:Ca-activated chloride channel family protein